MRKGGLLLCVVALAVSACSDDPAGPPSSPTAAGIYTLLTINNTPMPFPLLLITGYRLEVTSSRLTLQTDSTYAERFVITETIQGTGGPVITVDTSTASGRWLQSDTVITFVATDMSEQFDAVFKNQRLTYSVFSGDSSYTFIYQKQ